MDLVIAKWVLVIGFDIFLLDERIRLDTISISRLLSLLRLEAVFQYFLVCVFEFLRVIFMISARLQAISVHCESMRPDCKWLLFLFLNLSRSLLVWNSHNSKKMHSFNIPTQIIVWHISGFSGCHAKKLMRPVMLKSTNSPIPPLSWHSPRVLLQSWHLPCLFMSPKRI